MTLLANTIASADLRAETLRAGEAAWAAET
jgi:hypothetical protein